jgi:hypothetical protein
MTEPGREETGPVAAVARLFGLQLAAVVAIATAITLVVVAFGLGDDEVRTGLPGTTSSSPAAGETATETSPSSTPSATRTKRDRATPSKTAAPPPSTAESSPEQSATATSTGGDKRPKVDVLNQSAGQGAAEETAGLLRDAGWRVGRVDDFRGTVRTTTVYYLDDDLRRDANKLARDLPGSVRVLEGFSTLSEKRLSVVLVD